MRHIEKVITTLKVLKDNFEWMHVGTKRSHRYSGPEKVILFRENGKIDWLELGDENYNIIKFKFADLGIEPYMVTRLSRCVAPTKTISEDLLEFKHDFKKIMLPYCAVFLSATRCIFLNRYYKPLGMRDSSEMIDYNTHDSVMVVTAAQLRMIKDLSMHNNGTHYYFYRGQMDNNYKKVLNKLSSF